MFKTLRSLPLFAVGWICWISATIAQPDPTTVAPLQQTTRFAWPICGGYVAGSFGYQSTDPKGEPRFHTGLDFVSDYGAAVRAGAKGTVIAAEERNRYGRMVEIDHGNGFRTRYAFLQSYTVKPGDRVSRGQVVAAVGLTGTTTGPRLHFEIWFNDVVRDPLKYLEHDPACIGQRKGH